MEKPWYRSKTVWGGIALIVTGIGGYLTEDFSLLEAIFIDVLGWMGIAFRSAMK